MERRLAAILAADVVGYSHLVREDEASTLAALRAHREELIKPKLAQYHGRMVKLMGDGLLAEFPSAVEAVQCAVEMQHLIGAGNAEVPERRHITYRIGINIGDIVVEDDDIYGDGVNVAARLEGLADPNSICVARNVYDQVKDKLDLTFDHLGEKEVKNIAEPVSVYRVVLDGKAAALVTPVMPNEVAPRRRGRLAAVAAIAVLVLAVGGPLLWWHPWKPDAVPASIEKMAFPLPEKPSIAVLPFDNLSGDPSQDYLVDGITETIITELSRFRGLFVIARNSTFSYKGRPVKVQQVAEELGVQFVLEGSVQRSADRLRFTAQLIDATTGNHLWAESYDRDLSDIFSVQDEVTERIVASLGAYQGELAEAARERAKRKDPGSFSAYDAFLVAILHKHRFTKADNAAAEKLFNKAIQLDPQYAQAFVGLAWIHIQRFWFGWTDTPEQAVARTREAAQKAIALDPSEAEAHWLLAEAYLADGQFERAEAEFERALALNPNHADLIAGWGYASVLLGEPERGTEFIVKAMRLNPQYPDWYDRGLGTAAYMSRQYEQAIAAFKKVTQQVIQSRLYLAASYAQLGRLEEAQAEVAAAIGLDAEISVEKFSRIELYKNPADLEHLRHGLRLAGLPERSPLSLSGKPSIAVLPFVNLSNDPDQEFFADGVSGAIITELTRFPKLFVMGRNSSFQFKGQNVDVREVGRSLGVRYVVEGSVRKNDEDVRVTAQLLDATTGTLLWAETYERELSAKNVFAVQDDITNRIVSIIAGDFGVISRTRMKDAVANKTDSLDAYECVLIANAYDNLYTPEAHLRARTCMERAVELDPNYSDAWAWLGFLSADEYRYGFNPLPNSLDRALKASLHAVELDPRSYWAHENLAHTYFTLRDVEKFFKEADRALALNSNSSTGLAGLGVRMVMAGEMDRGIKLMEKAIALNPDHPGWYHIPFFYYYYQQDSYEKALAEAQEMNLPGWFWTHMLLAAAYGRLGREKEGRDSIAKLLELYPDFPTQARGELEKWNNPDAYIEKMMDGLHKAGLPK